MIVPLVNVRVLPAALISAPGPLKVELAGVVEYRYTEAAVRLQKDLDAEHDRDMAVDELEALAAAASPSNSSGEGGI